jgi:hypothetical protein
MQVVTQGRPRHRLPPVVARQVDDPCEQPVQTEPLTEREMQLGDFQFVNPGL